MYTKLLSAIGIGLLSLVLRAQSTDVAQVLNQVEQNNIELKALSKAIESRQYELQSGNNLPNPEIETYYQPWGNHITGDYTELQVSQSFDFPTVYGARSRLNSTEKEKLRLEYDTRRQAILQQAQHQCYELIYLEKLLQIETERVQQAKKVFSQIQELFNQEEVGMLELNKAKIAWMQEQFKVEQINHDKQNVLLALQQLNGDKEINFNQSVYINDVNIPEKERIWSDKLKQAPTLIALQKQELVALQQLKLAKNQSLPNLTLGYNYQGVSGSTYSGIYAGIAIPLWNNRYKVKSAASHVTFQQKHNSAERIKAYADFERQYNDYQIMLNKFRSYQETLQELNSDQLLMEAYELGEISFIEYHMEIRFYREAYDAMLEMEKELHQQKAEILKHQL